MAAIMDAILKIIAFPMWGLGDIYYVIYEIKYYPNPLKKNCSNFLGLKL